MDFKQIKSYEELVSSPVNEREKFEVSIIINKILNSTATNNVWIKTILDYLNNNNEDKQYNQYYFSHKDSNGVRKGNYHIISTEEDLPISITDEDVQILKKYNAKLNYILYEFEERYSLSALDFLSRTRTLKNVLESIGLSRDVKEHLCNLVFCKVKETIEREQEEKKIEQQKSVMSNQNIELLFKNLDFSYISKAVSKCAEDSNVELLNLIYFNAHNLLMNPNGSEFDKEQLMELIKKTGCYPGNLKYMNYNELLDFYNDSISKSCEEILIQIISISARNLECFGHILEQLSDSKNENVRLHCCGKGDFTKFLNDLSPRVSKVANIRHNFEKKWNSLDDEDTDKQRISFLTSAIENGMIFGYEEDTYISGEQASIYFIGKLVETSSGEFWIDKDIIKTISDSRIFAYVVNELVKQGEIILKTDKLPECFNKEIGTENEEMISTLVKRRKLINS